jgi:hypothetical protein
MYVSKCPTEDNGCLCGEVEYQNVSYLPSSSRVNGESFRGIFIKGAAANAWQQSVFQCLYSQCDTAHFGSALHYTLSQCSRIGGETVLLLPPISNHDSLRRREAEYLAGDKLYGSGSAVGYPTQSVSLRTQSANNYPTQSVGGRYSLSATPSSLLPPYFPLNTAALPATTSATPTESTYTAAAASATAGPELYTGVALRLVSSTLLPVFVIIAAFYLSL